MRKGSRRYKGLALLLACLLTLSVISACGGQNGSSQGENDVADAASGRYLVAIEDEPDTVDFQSTTIYYTVATNVFDRLVEMESDEDGNVRIQPSLAESWEVSEDGRTYTFHLREGVKFSNGAPLTSSDVLYTLTRLLTWPEGCNRDIAEGIVGAKRLERGETLTLEGVKLLGELDLSITLEEPFEAFLACISMPGASILDGETTQAAGELFGLDPGCTIGTGPFILESWQPGVGMLLKANPDCWSGAPKCAGVDLRFLTEPEDVRTMFENGELDLLDLDEVGSAAEFFLHGDIYQENLYHVDRISIVYIAMNETVKPLNDVRVRKALQYGLNRGVLLDAAYSGRGEVENGIYPRGLYGYNPYLPEIPYDPDAARELLAEAGYSDGFDLTFSVKASSTEWEMTLVRLAVDMWANLGVRATIRVLDESEFMRLRKSGELECYTAMWTADYNDPDNFVYTFFGSRVNTTFRSICYQNEAVMDRVYRARAITDQAARLREYRELEEIIVQEDAAWIPLFSRLYSYVCQDWVEGFRSTWNGSVKNAFRSFSIRE